LNCCASANGNSTWSPSYWLPVISDCSFDHMTRVGVYSIELPPELSDAVFACTIRLW
jgi:hypothetical protein